MTDVAMSVKVSRALLGLTPLEINDHLNYFVADFFGGQISWNRDQVTSPYLDGAVTVRRTRGMVNEVVTVEVLGATPAKLNTNSQSVVAAFIQDYFTITTVMDGVTKVYDCEAADYGLAMQGNRFVARQMQVKFSVPRRPIPVAGLV